MENNCISPREFGEFTVKVDHLEKQNEELKEQVAALNAKVDKLVIAVEQARISLRVLFAVGAFAAGAGVMIDKVASWFWR